MDCRAGAPLAIPKSKRATAAVALQKNDVHREKMIVQINGGGTCAKDIRDVLGTVENQTAVTTMGS